MTYTMADLVAATGVTARTIRSYIAGGYLAPPEGRGGGAFYSEDHYLRAIALVRMRAAGETWEVVAERVTGWSLQKVRAYVKKTDPPAPEARSPEPPAAPEAPDAPTPALEGEPRPAPPQLPGEGSSLDGEIDVSPRNTDDWLPDGPRWVPVPLLPGLALWVREDAAPLVRRTAAEIIRRYGSA